MLSDSPKDRNQDDTTKKDAGPTTDTDSPLKNVDQNDGGYGHGSGFDRE